MHGNAADVLADRLAFTRVNSKSDLNAHCLGVNAECLGAADGLGRSLEGHQVTVARALHELATEVINQTRCYLTEALQCRPPPVVSHVRGSGGG
jgi:hypothetical protein